MSRSVMEGLAIVYGGQVKRMPFNAAVEKSTLRKMRDILIKRIAVDKPQNPAHWWLRVNDEPNWLGDAELGNRTVGINSVLRIEFVYSPGGRPPPVAAPKKPYSVTDRVAQMIRNGIRSFQSDRSNNGVQAEAVCGMFGHVSVRSDLLNSPKSAFFLTRLSGDINPFVYLARQTEHPIGVAPFFTPGHVACVCFYRDSKEVMFLDASGSVHPQCIEMWKWINDESNSNEWTLSYTFANYQYLDKTSEELRLAGGNCSTFTVVQAIRCVAENHRYEGKRYTFSVWIDRMIKVLKLTKTENTKAGLNLIMNAWRKLIYILQGNGQSERDYCAYVDNFDLPNFQKEFESLTELFAFIKNFTQQDYSAQLSKISFTADVMFLDMFIDLKRGFDDILTIGNAMRGFLEEIPSRGFVSCTVCGVRVKGDALYCGSQCKRLASLCEH